MHPGEVGLSQDDVSSPHSTMQSNLQGTIPSAIQPQDQCSRVEEYRPHSDTFLSLDYLHYYFCADHVLRPCLFAVLVSWLFFLFSTLGISISDFFTPNLASIAQLLGLDENVAGVTFSAFGNDLFLLRCRQCVLIWEAWPLGNFLERHHSSCRVWSVLCVSLNHFEFTELHFCEMLASSSSLSHWFLPSFTTER